MKQLIEEYLDCVISSLVIMFGISLFTDFVSRIFGYL